MKTVELPIGSVTAPDWNSNQVEDAIMARLRSSIERYGPVVPLVVRRLAGGGYETVGGAHRLSILREMGMDSVTCVLVEVDDADARLLSQCLNRLHGEDDLGMRAELIRRVLKDKPMAEVLSVLPDSAEGLQGLATLGEADVAESLRQWQAEQAVRLKHFRAQLSVGQLEVVEEAIERAGQGVDVAAGGNPNRRGVALHHLCKFYLENTGGESP